MASEQIVKNGVGNISTAWTGISSDQRRFRSSGIYEDGEGSNSCKNVQWAIYILYKGNDCFNIRLMYD